MARKEKPEPVELPEGSLAAVLADPDHTPPKGTAKREIRAGSDGRPVEAYPATAAPVKG